MCEKSGFPIDYSKCSFLIGWSLLIFFPDFEAYVLLMLITQVEIEKYPLTKSMVYKTF